VDPEQQNIWESKRKQKMMTLLPGTISQSSSHPSDAVKGTKTHWGKSRLRTTLKEGAHKSQWKKNQTCVILI